MWHRFPVPSRIDLFRAAATGQGFPAADVDSWLSAVRLSIDLTADGDGPGAGRKGGLPRLPRDLPWPTGPDGDPLPLLLTVDCAALPQEDPHLRLPADGHLLFFMDYDDTWMDGEHHELEQQATQVLHVPAGAALVERSEHDARAEVEPRDLHATVRVSLPEEMDERFGELTALSRKFWPAGFPDERDVRLGGHGLVAHMDPELAVIGHELPYPDGADVLQLAEQAMREWVPLAQFDIEHPTYACTNARYIIRRTDLAAGNFSRVVSACEFTE